MRKKLCIIMAGLMLVAGLITGCSDYHKECESGDYIYNFRPRYENRGDTIGVCGLTESGKAKEVLIVPATLDDKVIYSFSGKTLYESSELKRIYIPTPMEFNEVIDAEEKLKETNVDAVVLISNSDATIFNLLDYSFIRLSAVNYPDWAEDGDKYIIHPLSDGRIPDTIPANVSYMYNYDGAKNGGYYWADDLNGETIKNIPPDPVREGYTFDGWYKERACQTEWNFEEDVIPEKEIFIRQTESGSETVYVYQETQLFAKWIKNEQEG